MSNSRQNENVREHQDSDSSEVIVEKDNAVDYVKALKRPFSDTRKFLVGTILGMIPIVNLTVIGYTLNSTGLAEDNGNRDGLPEWTNFVELFMKGLGTVAIGIIMLLPAGLILLGTFGSVITSPALSMIFGGVPMDTWNNYAAGQMTDIQMEDWFAQNWTEFIPVFTKAVPLLLLGGLLAAVAFYILPASILGWVKEDKFSAAFSWETVKMTMTLDYLVNWLIVGYLGGVLTSLLGWVPFLSTGIAMYVSGVFSYTVFAELYERATSEEQIMVSEPAALGTD